jgi:hypothetical protein
VEKTKPRIATRALEGVERGGNTLDGGEPLVGALRSRARCARPAKEIEPGGRLIGEEPEQLELLEYGARPFLPIEHLEDSQRPVAGDERDGHETRRLVAGRLGHVAGEARILLNALDHERLSGGDDGAGDTGPRGKAPPDELAGPDPGDRLEDEVAPLVIEQEDRGRGRGEDRPRGVGDGLEERTGLLVGREQRRGDRFPVALLSGHPPRRSSP